MVVVGVLLAACGGAPVSNMDPSNFVATIDNPWLPFAPGSQWVFEDESEDGLERIEVTVTDDTRQIMGITATVVRDIVTLDGEVIEDTFDWYAQDREGNVWYLGEATEEFENGEVVSTAGSWEAGVDGAEAGIIMKANPTVGDTYRQEFYKGEAEDMAEIVRTGEAVEVAFGSFEDVLVIKEWTPLEPGIAEEKYYARGVGPVLEVKVEGAEGRVELISFTAP
jgi:hypothetical protein